MLKENYKITSELKNLIESKLCERWSLEQIIGRELNTKEARGKEFSCWKEVEKMGKDFYFADPYCSWQRGCNENSNGILREFYPKKTDISKVETKDLLQTLMLINSRPRKCLNYTTQFEKFLYEIKFEEFKKMLQLISQFMKINN